MHARIGVLEMELALPGIHALKEKRAILKSLKDRLRNRFNVAVAEVAMNDAHQRAVLAAAAVANDGSHLNGLLDAVLAAARSRRDLVLVDFRIEVF